MTDATAIDICQKALLLSLYLSGPMLAVALIIGLAVSIFQAATQLNEMTMTFVPKIILVGAVLLYSMPWMIHLFKDYFNFLMNQIPGIHP
jgi:flagellar biosynthetic protein FliQ